MSKNRTLLKSQRNAVLHVLQEAGLPAKDFLWSEEQMDTGDQPWVSVLTYTPDERLFFRFGWDTDQEIARFAPGEEKRVEDRWVTTWEIMLFVVGEWAKLVKREAEEPDLWELATRSAADFVGWSALDGIPDLPIPPEEQRLIALRLEELERRIGSEFQLDDRRFRFVRSQLRQLAEGAATQTKLSWAQTFVGVLFSIALYVAPKDPQRVFELAREAFQPILMLLGP